MNAASSKSSLNDFEKVRKQLIDSACLERSKLNLIKKIRSIKRTSVNIECLRNCFEDVVDEA